MQIACRPAAARWAAPQQAGSAAGRAPAPAAAVGRRRAAHVAPRALNQVWTDLTVEAFEEMMGGEQPVLVDMYTTWCGPCKVIACAMEKLEPEYQGRLEMHKIDCEKNLPIARHLKVAKLPTLVVYHKGRLIDRVEGVMTAQDMDLRLKGLLKQVEAAEGDGAAETAPAVAQAAA